MNIDNERKAFEEWIKNEDPFMGNDDNQYCIWAKKYMWKAWQARVPEGYVVVPKDPTREMMQAVVDEVKKSGHLVDFYKAMIGACDEP